MATVESRAAEDDQRIIDWIGESDGPGNKIHRE
jgi:hypothetical protein